MTVRVMVDLETMGTVPGCAILSIGAVEFNVETGKLGKEFYQVVNLQSCLDAGLHVNEDTKAWWGKQSAEAQKVVKKASGMRGNKTIAYSLMLFNDYLDEFKDPQVYGNGADFDNPILAVAYLKAGIEQGWKPYQGRCYRTLKSEVAPHIKLVRQGVHHNALADAKSQAEHAIKIFQYLNEIRIKD